ncbi:MAG: GNAT family N-acetyltransferase [Candidatus Thorarchaeota archaeon]|nr:GNAT family N-acetyltransferase [Candidatus Thorarchaeota archaeon]
MIEEVNDENITEVLDIIGESPFDNIILIADLTQLKEWCEIKLVRSNGSIQGIFSLYRDLDFLAGAFWVQDARSLKMLVDSYGSTLQNVEMVFICTKQQLQMLQEIAEKIEPIKERQMVMEAPDKLVCKEVAPVDRLTMNDAEELRDLYRVCGTPAWTPNALNFGPFYGVRDEQGKIVSVAGVHFVTKFGSEIGNVATHPNHRRKGYAICCIAATTKEVLKGSDRVLLHFFEDNIGAKRLYEKMGFVYSPVDPVYFTKATLGWKKRGKRG